MSDIRHPGPPATAIFVAWRQYVPGQRSGPRGRWGIRNLHLVKSYGPNPSARDGPVGSPGIPGILSRAPGFPPRGPHPTAGLGSAEAAQKDVILGARPPNRNRVPIGAGTSSGRGSASSIKFSLGVNLISGSVRPRMRSSSGRWAAGPRKRLRVALVAPSPVQRARQDRQDGHPGLRAQKTSS